MEKERSSFSGRLGFVMAAASSAVGLGNIWRFPYLAAKYGGGIFLLVYVLLSLTFGFALMTTEIALGRKTRLSLIGAFSSFSKKYSFIGYLGALVPLIIFPYYCVIGGWVTKYFMAFASGGATSAAGDNYFSSFISQPVQPLFWLLIFIGATAVIVFLGVEKGVEKASKLMMPILVVLSVVIAIYTILMPGTKEGIIYYLKPNFSSFSVNTVLAAMGQMFYSMSLAMGIMITYGSYMKKDVNIETSVLQIELFDTGIAFVSGLMIVPAVFAFSGGDPSALSAGPGLMFITLPKVFDSMPMGTAIGALFFLLVLFAALTSSISLMETIVSFLVDGFKLSRKASCLLVLIISVLLAIPSSLGFGILDWVAPLGMSILDFFDFLSNSILMPIVALLTCLFVTFVIGSKTISDEVKTSSEFKLEKLFHIVIKYVAPVLIIGILVSSTLDALGIIKI